MSSEQRSTRGRQAGLARTRPARAFTLLELLVVIGIVALLATILLPSMSQSLHVARDRICRNHLFHVGQIAHRGALNVQVGALDPFGLPGSDAWVGPVGAVDRCLLLCPEDDTGGTVNLDDVLSSFYILQHQGSDVNSGWHISNLAAAFGMGGGVLDDGQLHIDPTPTPVHTGAHDPNPCFHLVPVRKPNQRIAAVCSEAILVVTFGDGGQITFESVIGCNGYAGKTDSDHWLMKGNTTNGAQCLAKDTTIMQLGGKSHSTVDPPYSFNTDATSYGMNNQVDHVGSILVAPRMYSPQQLMIMDANQPQLKVGEAGWMDHVSYRHFGKVNYVGTGGMALSASKAQLTREYNALEDKGDAGGSLWGRQAAPAVGKD